MGFIERHKALCMLSVLINTHLLMAAREAGVRRYFYSSSACVYNAAKQAVPGVAGLAESDAYPAMPEDGYGWEKLFSERMCRHFSEDFGLETRVARYHNVYGRMAPTTADARAPAAICRKVIRRSSRATIASSSGATDRKPQLHLHHRLSRRHTAADGERRPDTVEHRQQRDGHHQQAGGSRRADRRRSRDSRIRYQRAPGCRRPNSDNSQIRRLLGWEPSTPLLSGLEATTDGFRRCARALSGLDR
jgi:nucleoside-diphosphate-sugar epimerase